MLSRQICFVVVAHFVWGSYFAMHFFEVRRLDRKWGDRLSFYKQLFCQFHSAKLLQTQAASTENLCKTFLYKKVQVNCW